MSRHGGIATLARKFRDVRQVGDVHTSPVWGKAPMMKGALNRFTDDVAPPKVSSLMTTTCIEHGHLSCFCTKSHELSPQWRFRYRPMLNLMFCTEQIPCGGI